MIDYLIRYVATEGNNEHNEISVSVPAGFYYHWSPFIFSYKSDINVVYSNALSGGILNLLLLCIIF
jgi:hypothetical protein